MSAHLTFRLLPWAPGRVTDMWAVSGVQDVSLGRVVFWAPWRRYVFEPLDQTLYDVSCLREITAFIETRMAVRRRRYTVSQPSAERAP